MPSKPLLLIGRLLNSNGVVSLRASIVDVCVCPDRIELQVSDGISSVSLPAYVSNAYKTDRGGNSYNIEVSAWGYSPFAVDSRFSISAVLQYSKHEELIPVAGGESYGRRDLSTQRRMPGLVLKVIKAWKLLAAGKIGFLWKAVKLDVKQWTSRSKRIKINYRHKHPDLTDDHRNRELFIDHAFGGGTNTYSVNYLQEARKTNMARPIVLAFDPWRLQFRVTFSSVLHDKVLWFSDVGGLCKWISRQAFSAITINSVYGFPSPVLLLETLQRYKNYQPRTRMRVMTHDYYSICPSPHLINHEGKFCGIPELDECSRCFGKNKLIISSPSHATSVREWRSVWQGIYDVADRIRVFSMSSARILSKGFPKIAPSKFEVVPHRVSKLPAVPAPDTTTLHIGVIGHLTSYKGSRQVHELMQHVEHARTNVVVTVFGSIYPPCEYRCAHVHHHYDVKKLPQLVQRAGVNIFFFPSICPETYSYVVDEMMHLGLPIVCFDIGAPADRVRSYATGAVIPIGTGQDTLVAIEELFVKTYKTHHSLGAT